MSDESLVRLMTQQERIDAIHKEMSCLSDIEQKAFQEFCRTKANCSRRMARLVEMLRDAELGIDCQTPGGCETHEHY